MIFHGHPVRLFTDIYLDQNKTSEICLIFEIVDSTNSYDYFSFKVRPYFERRYYCPLTIEWQKTLETSESISKYR